MREAAIFGGLPERVLARLTRAIRVVRAEAGAQILAEGDVARCTFVVAEGELVGR